MLRRGLPIFLLVTALAIYGFIMPDLWESREKVRTDIPADYIFPSKFSRIMALGNQGVLSDFLFLKTMTFIGERGVAGTPLSEKEWEYVVRCLDVVTDLDPYFVDPYMLAEGLLAWDALRPEDANLLLNKGMQYRDWDWRLPFFVGFNSFYFLGDYETASGFIMQAAQLPGSPSYLKTLGARLAYYGGKSKTALLFLQQMLAETDDALLKKRLAMRLQALEGAVAIEEALDRYRGNEGRAPDALEELVGSGYLDEMPKEPYGGEWGIAKNGRVFSTSKFVERGTE